MDDRLAQPPVAAGRDSSSSEDVNPFAMLLGHGHSADEELPGDDDALPGRGLLKHGSDMSSLNEYFTQDL